MKTVALALLAAVLPLVLRAQETPPQERELTEEEQREKARRDALAAFYQGTLGAGGELETEIEGAWILMDYLDPQEREIASGFDGFALFHDGFLMLQVAIQTFDTRLFHVANVLLLQTGAYRYRFEGANLQLSTISGYTSFTADNDLEREPSGEAYEYIATLDEGVLELRTEEGVVFTFRRTTAGEFPDSAVRAIEGRRSGTPQWELPDQETPPLPEPRR